MLKKFSVKNFKNFKEKISLNLESSNYGFNNDAIEHKVIKNSIIYGYNGSGKSNIVRAIMDITTHMTDYEVDKPAYESYLCLDSHEEYATFKYEFLFDEQSLTYTYKKKTVDSIFDERLFIGDDLIIDSSKKIVSLKGTENLNLDYDDSISFVRYVLRNTVMNSEDAYVEVFQKFEAFVQGMLSFNSLEGNTYQGLERGSSSLNDIILKYGELKDFENFLNKAGLPYKLGIETVDDKEVIVVKFSTGKTINLFKIASKGTKALILFYTWLLKFDKVSMVLMDEFDSYFHNKMTKLVLQEVIDSGVQSLFSSHNTSVMTNDILRPDCYYVLSDNMICSLDKTTNKELRKAHNLEKMYRAGAFD